MPMKNALKVLFSALGYRAVPLHFDTRRALNVLLKDDIRTVIDVGAARGSTVADWLARWPMAHIHAIEPLPAQVKSLESLAQKHSKRVSVWPVAAGSRDGVQPLNVHPGHTTSSSFLLRTDYCARAMPLTSEHHSIEVPICRLDSIFDSQQIQLPALLKLDVQGYETDVLRGASNLLSKVNYVLTEVSLAPVYVGQSSFNDVNCLMNEFGFDLVGVVEQFHLADGTPIYVDVLYSKRN